MLGNVVAEVAAVHDVDDKIEVFAVLERIVHVYKEATGFSGCADLRVLELLEELLFVHDRVDTAFRNNSSLLHFLHRVEFALFLLLHLPDLAEAAAADDVLELEVVLGNGYSRVREVGLTRDVVVFVLRFEVAISHF